MIRNFLEFCFDEEVGNQTDAKDRNYAMISPDFCPPEKLSALELCCSCEVLAADGNCLFHVQGDCPSRVISLENTRRSSSWTCSLSPSFKKDSAVPPELAAGMSKAFLEMMIQKCLNLRPQIAPAQISSEKTLKRSTLPLWRIIWAKSGETRFEYKAYYWSKILSF